MREIGRKAGRKPSAKAAGGPGAVVWGWILTLACWARGPAVLLLAPVIILRS